MMDDVEHIHVVYNEIYKLEMPTCDVCGGCGLGYGSGQHHHTCTVEGSVVAADDELWEWLGHTVPEGGSYG